MKIGSFVRVAPGLIALEFLAGLCPILATAQDRAVSNPAVRTNPKTSVDVGADLRSSVLAAAQKLAGQSSFAWKTMVAVAEGQGPFGGGGGATSGWTERGGYTRVNLAASGGPEFVTRAGKAAVLVDGNWQTLEQGVPRRGSGQPGPIGFSSSLVTDFKLPAALAEMYRGRATSFSKERDTVTAVLSADTVKELLSAGGPPGSGRRRTGGGAPRGGGSNPFGAPIKDPQGSVTFQIESGVLTGLTLKLSGSRQIFDREIKLDRTTTTTITGLGATRVDVADDAREIVEALIAGRRPDVFVPEPGFRKLFDGRTLAGWNGRPGFWSVKDRAITGRTTTKNPLRKNTFLFARTGESDLDCR